MSSKTITQNDLTNILNEIFPATSDDMTPAQIEDFVQSLNAVATSSVDYIVEQGISGIWTYRKWNSGIAECWGIYTETSVAWSATTAASGGYRATTSAIPFPFTFAATPVVNAQSNSTSNDYWGTIANSTATTTQVIVIIDRGATATGKVNLAIQVSGRWK